MKICPTCKQKILSKRSVEISTHFHAHITQIAKELARPREQVYYDVLIFALETESDGAVAYPYSIIARKVTIDRKTYYISIPEPWRTSRCSNRQMMTAVEACHMYAVEREIILKEKCPFCKGEGCTTCNYTGMEQ